MPIYEYQCQACGHTLEALQKINEALLTDCPNCQKATLEKLVSATSFQLKGTGWYVTDFRNKNAGEANKSDANDANKGPDAVNTNTENTRNTSAGTAETKPSTATSTETVSN